MQNAEKSAVASGLGCLEDFPAEPCARLLRDHTMLAHIKRKHPERPVRMSRPFSFLTDVPTGKRDVSGA